MIILIYRRIPLLGAGYGLVALIALLAGYALFGALTFPATALYLWRRYGLISWALVVLSLLSWIQQYFRLSGQEVEHITLLSLIFMIALPYLVVAPLFYSAPERLRTTNEYPTSSSRRWVVTAWAGWSLAFLAFGSTTSWFVESLSTLALLLFLGVTLCAIQFGTSPAGLVATGEH